MKPATWIKIIPILFGIATQTSAQRYNVFEIRNCQHERRTATFEGQINSFWHCARANKDISQYRILQFSPAYQVETAQLQKQVVQLREAVPNDFLNIHLRLDWRDNIPDTPGIWFIIVLTRIDQSENITAYAAYRITFDGTDARVEEQRMAPKITNVEFIFDKPTLVKLAKYLKTLPDS